jgi:hypothetical protein
VSPSVSCRLQDIIQFAVSLHRIFITTRIRVARFHLQDMRVSPNQIPRVYSAWPRLRSGCKDIARPIARTKDLDDISRSHRCTSVHSSSLDVFSSFQHPIHRVLHFFFTHLVRFFTRLCTVLLSAVLVVSSFCSLLWRNCLSPSDFWSWTLAPPLLQITINTTKYLCIRHFTSKHLVISNFMRNSSQDTAFCGACVLQTQVSIIQYAYIPTLHNLLSLAREWLISCWFCHILVKIVVNFPFEAWSLSELRLKI